MTSLDWFEIGVDTGLAIAWIIVRLGRYQRDRRRGQPGAPPPRTFSDGAAQLIDQLDRQKTLRK